MTMTPERRGEILAAVAAWLDDAQDEPLPAGIDPRFADDVEPAPDLAGAIGAIIGLRHDIKLQTKAFRRVEEQLGTAVEALQTERERAARTSDPTAAVVELHDRLRRCARACSAAGDSLPAIMRRATAARRLAGIGEGIELVVERARAMLADRGLRSVDPLGEPFDPSRMHAVGRVPPSQEHPDGSVAQTVLVGIERIDDDTILRPAEVLIARLEHTR